MTGLDEISIIWSEIRKRGQITKEELKDILSSKKPELVNKLDEILMHLYKLYMIDYDGNTIKIPTLIDPEILRIPCLGCEKLKTCKPGSKNNPFRCEKFVKWFIKKFVE